MERNTRDRNGKGNREQDDPLRKIGNHSDTIQSENRSSLSLLIKKGGHHPAVRFHSTVNLSLATNCPVVHIFFCYFEKFYFFFFFSCSITTSFSQRLLVGCVMTIFFHPFIIMMMIIVVMIIIFKSFRFYNPALVLSLGR